MNDLGMTVAIYLVTLVVAGLSRGTECFLYC